jgi:hypothetical protein
MIVKALPIPLQGLGSQLYQIAWLERFDVTSVQLRERLASISIYC